MVDRRNGENGDIGLARVKRELSESVKSNTTSRISYSVNKLKPTVDLMPQDSKLNLTYLKSTITNIYYLILPCTRIRGPR